MRFVAILVAAVTLAAPASATAPRFGLFDLHDLSKASRNEFGDVKPTQRIPPAPFAVECAAGCRLGSGWLGFTRLVGPTAADIRSASAGPGRIGWSVRLDLTARGRARWRAFAKVAAARARKAGVPDVLALVVGGRILAAPLADTLRLMRGRLDVPGFTPANARIAVKALAS
ncbi:MAG TPA: hypothetical protein VGH82_15545 [Gaiellaceae bacterium]|jgi:hypothetical protein